MATTRTHLGTLRSALAVLLAVLLSLLLLPAPSARGTVIWSPNLEITGDPTAAEVQDIQEAWTVLTSAFPSTATCMEAVTVHVVDRVEDHYSYPISFSIAAFYRYPPSSTVFIEHGKVRPAVILHEFAHHMDVSCGFGRSDHGDHFLEAEGYETSHEWIHGTSWYRVPAERFAEGVLMYLGVEEIEIVVGGDAIDLIAAWAVTDRDVPTEVAPGLVVV